MCGFALRGGWVSRCWLRGRVRWWGSLVWWRRALVHPRERRNDVLTIQHRVWCSTRMEWDALAETFHLVPQHLYLP